MLVAHPPPETLSIPLLKPPLECGAATSMSLEKLVRPFVAYCLRKICRFFSVARLAKGVTYHSNSCDSGGKGRHPTVGQTRQSEGKLPIFCFHRQHDGCFEAGDRAVANHASKTSASMRPTMPAFAGKRMLCAIFFAGWEKLPERSFLGMLMVG